MKIGYLAAKPGQIVIKVNPKHSSQKCRNCGNIDKSNRDCEKFICVECGHHEHADIGPAKTIRDRVLELVGGDSRVTSHWIPKRPKDITTLKELSWWGKGTLTKGILRQKCLKNLRAAAEDPQQSSEWINGCGGITEKIDRAWTIHAHSATGQKACQKSGVHKKARNAHRHPEVFCYAHLQKNSSPSSTASICVHLR